MAQASKKRLQFQRATAFEKGKTCYWGVFNETGQLLGAIKYRPTWRKYIFAPSADTEFDASCLQEIVDFLIENKNNRV